MSTRIAPILDTPFQRQMAQGHLARKGHPLKGHQVSPDGIVWATVRECCGETDEERMPKTWEEIVPASPLQANRRTNP